MDKLKFDPVPASRKCNTTRPLLQGLYLQGALSAKMTPSHRAFSGLLEMPGCRVSILLSEPKYLIFGGTWGVHLAPLDAFLGLSMQQRS